MFKPKLFSTLKGYTFSQFTSDLTAGLIVGIVALPLSIALAIASGVSPEKGLITACVAGFFISFLGGSSVQIGGPTGAFVIIIYNIIAQHGLKGLTLATIMAGVFLVIMGFLKFGSYIKFIPWPITTGFTSGIAIVILSTQLKDFTGIVTDHDPSEFLEKLAKLWEFKHTIFLPSLLIGIGSFLLIYFWPKKIKKIPGTLVAIVLSTLANSLFHLNADTIGSRFGNLTASFSFPDFTGITLQEIQALLPSAFTIAILAGIESLLSAVVADGMTGGKHSPNMELIAQGVANICSALTGGIAATGAIARTAANVKNGGQTPVAGIVHSVAIAVMMFLFMPYASMIPMSCLAAILINVALNMGEWKVFIELFKAPKSDFFIFLLTFALTILFDLVVAIEVGMVLAAILFVKRMADVSGVRPISDEITDLRDPDNPLELLKLPMPEQVQVYEVNGPFFFGAATRFTEVMGEISVYPKVFILRLRHVPAMDATGLNALEHLKWRLDKKGTILLLSGVQEQPAKVLEKSGFIDSLGAKSIHKHLNSAVKMANQLVNHTYGVEIEESESA